MFCAIISIIDSEEVVNMMYPYVQYPDSTEVFFSNIYIKDGIECIDVHFERPTENGFDSVTCTYI